MSLLIEVVPQEVVRMLREPFGLPGADIFAARTDGPTQDQGSRPRHNVRPARIAVRS